MINPRINSDGFNLVNISNNQNQFNFTILNVFDYFVSCLLR